MHSCSQVSTITTTETSHWGRVGADWAFSCSYADAVVFFTEHQRKPALFWKQKELKKIKLKKKKKFLILKKKKNELGPYTCNAKIIVF